MCNITIEESIPFKSIITSLLTIGGHSTEKTDNKDNLKARNLFHGLIRGLTLSLSNDIQEEAEIKEEEHIMSH